MPVRKGRGSPEAPRPQPELTRDNAEATGLAPNGRYRSMQKSVMQALKERFTADVGLMSVGGIAFMLGMAVFFVRYFMRHMRKDGRARR